MNLKSGKSEMLYFIGLGLGDAKDITVKGLEIVKTAKKVFLEHYTSILGCDQAQLEEFYGRELILADRDLVESGAEEILADAKNDIVAFLVVGDPFGATTHSDLDLRYMSKLNKIEVEFLYYFVSMNFQGKRAWYQNQNYSQCQHHERYRMLRPTIIFIRRNSVHSLLERILDSGQFLRQDSKQFGSWSSHFVSVRHQSGRKNGGKHDEESQNLRASPVHECCTSCRTTFENQRIQRRWENHRRHFGHWRCKDRSR